MPRSGCGIPSPNTSRFRRLFRFSSRSAGDVRTQIQDEFTFHIDMRVADLIATSLRHAARQVQDLLEPGRAEATPSAAMTRSVTPNAVPRCGARLRGPRTT